MASSAYGASNTEETEQGSQDSQRIDPLIKENNEIGKIAKSGFFEMDEVVVTATRQADSIRNIPKNVTVITSEDIAQASSNNVVDLLAREANLNLRSFFGSDKKAGIDIRGMGDTYVSNVIVMVDGIRLNTPDLAGPDYSTVPLGQIDRIEVVRGAGSVLYGDGAVGGVINIITKKGERDPELMLYSSYGSYDTYDGRASLGRRFLDLTFNVNGDYYDSDGYRDNGYLRKKDGGIHLCYELNETVSLSLGASNHDDSYGLPGPVSKVNADSSDDRVNTNFPEDYGDTATQLYTSGIDVDLDKYGVFKVRGSYRKRENSYIMGYSSLISKEAQSNTIDEDSKQLDLTYRTRYVSGPLEYGFLCGMAYQEVDYFGDDRAQSREKHGDIEATDWFLNNEWVLFENLILSAGYRKSRSKMDFFDDRFGLSTLFDNTRSDVWQNRAYDVGITYLLDRNTTLFVNHSKSFRSPNVDELVLGSDDLHPQKGYHLDIGVRHSMAGLLEMAFTFFQIKIEDEIYYGEDPPGSGMSINRNYDEKTIRRGVEFDIKFFPTDYFFMWGNYSYTNAKFDESNNYIPLVPRHKASLGLECRIMEPLLLSVTGTFVGSRYDGNDQDNNLYEKLESYQVVDAKLSYEYKWMTLFAGVNNIFNDLYTTSAYSEYYYTMPTCNAYAGLSWRY